MHPKINWYYHRKNCNSCTKAEAWLKQNNIERPELIIANKIKFNREEALQLIRASKYAMITRGRKRLDLTINDMTDDDIAALALGRSGTLRAPAFQYGEHFIIGFHDEAYADLLLE